MNTLAKELVGLPSDLLTAHTTQPVAALQRETKTIPIVFLIVSDPVGSGFVASLPSPGGNITGFINIESSLGGKWIELLREVAPNVSRAALMFNPDTAPYSKYYLEPFEAAARLRGIEPIAAPVRTEADIEHVIAELADRPNAGLAVMPDVSLSTQKNRELILSLAARRRLLAVYPYRYWVSDGGLASYGIDQIDLYRRVSTYIDRISQGRKGRRTAVAIAHPVRIDGQSQNRKGTRADDPGVVPAARRRGDRMKRREFIRRSIWSPVQRGADRVAREPDRGAI